MAEIASILNQLQLVDSQTSDSIKGIGINSNTDNDRLIYVIDSINNAVNLIAELKDNTAEVRNSIMTLLNKYKETVGMVKSFANSIVNNDLSSMAMSAEQGIDNAAMQSEYEPTILGAPEVPGMKRENVKVRTLTPNYNSFRNAA